MREEGRKTPHSVDGRLTVFQDEQNDRMFGAEAAVFCAHVEASVGQCDVTDDEIRAVFDAESRRVVATFLDDGCHATGRVVVTRPFHLPTSSTL